VAKSVAPITFIDFFKALKRLQTGRQFTESHYHDTFPLADYLDDYEEQE